jgi:hypothetical protein
MRGSTKGKIKIASPASISRIILNQLDFEVVMLASLKD